MQKKLPLFLAALMMVFAFQTASVKAADDEDDQDFAVEQQDDEFCPGWGRGQGRRFGGWRGGPGHGPALPPGVKGMGMGRGMGMHHGMMGPRFMDQLDLTDAQKTQVVDALTNNFRERLLARMESAEAMKKLRELHESDSPSHDAIIAANQAVGAARGKMDVLGRKMKDEIKNILTPDQQKKLEELRDAPRKFRDGREDGPRGPGRGPRGMTGPGPRMMGPGGR